MGLRNGMGSCYSQSGRENCLMASVESNVHEFCEILKLCRTIEDEHFTYDANMMYMFIFNLNHIMIYFFCLLPKKICNLKKAPKRKRKNIYKSSIVVFHVGFTVVASPQGYRSSSTTRRGGSRVSHVSWEKTKLGGAICDGWNVVPNELGSLSGLCWWIDWYDWWNCRPTVI